ncbi:hypothetical protein, conserved [Eimeria praecox]|uniref:Uncharacterized protein n=1 Tax=Eimeria praecox TaxID=51316 RepID=U6G5E6_9EIME|nr:hypothetical protein, conserved [Eimeria praecox]
MQRRLLQSEHEQHSETDRTDEVPERQQPTEDQYSNAQQDGQELLNTQNSRSIPSLVSINDEMQLQTVSAPAGEDHQVESNEQQLPQAEQHSEANLQRDVTASEPQRPVEEELVEHQIDQIQRSQCGQDAPQSSPDSIPLEQNDGLPCEDSQLQTAGEHPEQVQGQALQVENQLVLDGTGNSRGYVQEMEHRQDVQEQNIPLQQHSSGTDSQFTDQLHGENPLKEQADESHLEPLRGQQPEEEHHDYKDIPEERNQRPPEKAQVGAENVQAEHKSGGPGDNIRKRADPGARRQSHRAKTSKRTKKPQNHHPPADTSTDNGNACKETPMKRPTEILFDAKTAMALQSLCALQQQTPGLASSVKPGDSKELDEVEKCFVFGDDEIEAEALEKDRAERLQRVESLRTVAIVRQNITTQKAFQDLQEALTSEEVVVGFAEDADEERSRWAAETGKAQEQQKERLQSQADRLRQEAQMIRDRIIQQVKGKQAEFKEARKVAAREHEERKAEMLQTLQSFQLRMEAILQHRRLELLQSYGFLRRDFNTTNYSLKAKIPRAASAALGLERGSEGPNWKLMPQTLRLRLDLCRAVKDGVPRGQYVMMVSVWNRLGGHRLVWKCLNKELASAEESKQNTGERSARGSAPCALATGSCAVSAPVAFAAMYFSECLRFDETLYLNCPSEADIKPSMCLVFQLYLLRGAVSPVDKVPLFLGEVDTSVQRYLEMEDMLRMRLDKWLCNLYFRIVRVPKELDGLQEFEVPLHYTGRMLNIPDELPLPAEMRFSSSTRNSHSIRSSRSSTVISEQTLLHRGVTGRKLRHIWSELFEEYSLSSDMKEISLAGAALLFALGALWFSVFVAMFGSWVTLKACNIPVYSAEISGMYIRFGYVEELLSFGPAALYSASGFVAALLVFALLCCMAHLAHCFVGRLPNAAYRFMAPLGVWVLLLPIILAIIEALGRESSGMTFALHNYLEREFASGATGVALTVLMDIACMAMSSVVFYYYAVAIHHNGRVLDCHRRLTSDSATFRFPNDTEVSERYMKACCYTAKQFVGLDGETRRVQVTQLRVLDCGSTTAETVGKKNKDAVTTYIAIFTVHPTTKQQTLYRHFLRYPDGTIVEQLYSVPLNLELASPNCPTQVTQCSFEETGFLQHQPTESVMPFEEWRRSRFGNMRPTVILDSVPEPLKCSPAAEKVEGIEAPSLLDCLTEIPEAETQPNAHFNAA